MKLHVSLCVLLANLVAVSIQQCAIEDLDAVDLLASTFFTDDLGETFTINSTFYNCLETSQTVGLYQTMALSFLYIRSNAPNALQEVRYNMRCSNTRWVQGGLVILSALQNNNTRLNCSSCLNQTVNEYHCTC